MIDYELKEIYILGDLNCDLHSSKTYRPTDLLNSLSELYPLDQLIVEPTRCTINSRNLIDVIFTNCPNRVAASGVLHLGISDHSLVYAIRKVAIPNKNSHKVVKVRNMKSFNANSLKSYLMNLP